MGRHSGRFVNRNFISGKTTFFAALLAAAFGLSGQTPSPATNGQYTLEGIAAPLQPLPDEEASAGVEKFSFIVYGDTRGRRDGKEVQYEHSLVIDSMLETIRKLKATPFPVKFVLQSGDAVVNGQDPRQWGVSFIGLINRLTREAGLPYFLAPGNHDVTAAQTINAPGRGPGLSNYLAAVAN